MGIGGGGEKGGEVVVVALEGSGDVGEGLQGVLVSANARTKTEGNPYS